MDIKCVVCGEPWDAYGVSHGDMCKWEADLFRKGAGCPSCEGVAPKGLQWQPETIFDVENGDEDPMVRINAHEAYAAGDAPKWEQPAPVVLWECTACGVRAERDSEGELSYEGGSARRYHSYHRMSDATPDEEPAHTFDENTRVCEFCLDHCDKCGEACSSHLEGDVYDVGVGVYSQDHNEVFHVDCLLEQEEEDNSEYFVSHGYTDLAKAICAMYSLSDRACDVMCGEVLHAVHSAFNHCGWEDSAESIADRIPDVAYVAAILRACRAHARDLPVKWETLNHR